MKRFFAMLVAALAMICVATACDDEPEVVPEVKKFLELSPVTIKATDVAAEYSFTVKASHPWTAECESDWVKVKKIWG
ncbi:MAG: BACON domain-containing protein, partial [Rikenellaceae bacterium]|nr:BACON domain-containing protein [Rikenellaceae bacterium]